MLTILNFILLGCLAICMGFAIIIHWCIGIPSSINRTISYYEKQKNKGYQSNNLTPIFLCLYFIFSILTFWIWIWKELKYALNNEPNILDQLDFSVDNF